MAIFIKLKLIRVVEGVRFHRMSEKRDNQMIMLDCLHKILLSVVLPWYHDLHFWYCILYNSYIK